MCFHVVPALREYGGFTVGISESICIEADGARVLGHTPRPIAVV